MGSVQIDRLYREGVAALRAGDKQTARDRLLKVVELEQTHEQAWLWLSACVETREEQIVCLENVLTINPDNAAARRGLAQLGVLPDRVETPSPASRRAPSPSVAPPRAIDSQREDLLTGRKQPRSAHIDDDSWRNPLVETQTANADRLLKEMDKADLPEGADTSLLNLFDAWVNALIFSRRGAYDVEMKIAGFGRIFFNLALAGLLAGVIGALVYGLLLVPLGGIEGFLALTDTPLPDLESLELLKQTINQLGFASIIINVLSLMVGRVIYGFIVSMVADRLGTKGETLSTIHALSIASVAQQVVLLIPVVILIAMLATSMPLQTASAVFIPVGVAYSIYQLAQDINAVAASNPGFGIGRSFLSLILANAVISVFFCCCSFGAGFLTSLPS